MLNLLGALEVHILLSYSYINDLLNKFLKQGNLTNHIVIPATIYLFILDMSDCFIIINCIPQKYCAFNQWN